MNVLCRLRLHKWDLDLSALEMRRPGETCLGVRSLWPSEGPAVEWGEAKTQCAC